MKKHKYEPMKPFTPEQMKLKEFLDSHKKQIQDLEFRLYELENEQPRTRRVLALGTSIPKAISRLRLAGAPDDLANYYDARYTRLMSVRIPIDYTVKDSIEGEFIGTQKESLSIVGVVIGTKSKGRRYSSASA